MEKEKIKWTDKTSAVSTIILTLATVILAWYTYCLFKETSHAGKISEDAVTQAKIAADASKKSADFSDSIFRITKDEVSASNSSFNKSLEIADKSANAAKKTASMADSGFKLNKISVAKTDSNFIKSMNISLANLNIIKSNFEIENKPYVFVSDFIVDSLKPLKNQHIGVRVKNFGKSPAFFYYLSRRIDISTDTVFKDFNYTVDDIQSINIFFPPGKEIDIPFKTPVVDSSAYNLFAKRNVFFYVHGEIVYKDLVRNKMSIAAFCFRVLPDARFLPMPYHNDIYEMNSDSSLIKK